MTERAISELEHIEPVSIHSLLTTEALAGAGRSSLSREGEAGIAAADVIVAHDTDTGRERLVHGRRVLEEMARFCDTPACTILRVEMGPRLERTRAPGRGDRSRQGRVRYRG